MAMDTARTAAGLDAVRRKIQELDAELVDLMVQRCRLAGTAGARKLEAGLPILDPGQEASVVRRGAARARAAGIDEELVRQIFWCLIELSRAIQVRDPEGGELPAVGVGPGTPGDAGHGTPGDAGRGAPGAASTGATPWEGCA
jgi:chorismate mutase